MILRRGRIIDRRNPDGSRKRLSRRRLFAALFLLIFAAVAACDTTIPPVPPITVNITALSNTTAVQQGINDALTATHIANDGLTATVLAQGGITLTPSNTPTFTVTPTPSPTRFLTFTPTPTATSTLTPTFAPYLTNTLAPTSHASTGWIRVINVWRDPLQPGADNTFDVYINNQVIARSLALGAQTNYFRVIPGAIRVTLRSPDQNLSDAVSTASLLSRVIDVPMGGGVSIVALNLGKGLDLLPVVDDLTPLPSGQSRLTILQADSLLPNTNVFLATQQRALAYNFKPGDVVGPFDLATGNYPVGLYDTENTALLLMNLPDQLRLANRVNYIMVLLPPGPESRLLADKLLISGITQRLDTDISARFVNVSSQSVSLYMDGELQVADFAAGKISESLPISRLGTTITVNDAGGNKIFEQQLDPIPGTAGQITNEIILVSDGAPNTSTVALETLIQNAPASAINANIRLIHALPNTRPLTMQIRPVRKDESASTQATPGTDSESAWLTVAQANEAGTSSAYFNRVPDIYDVRVILTGSQDVVGIRNNVEFLPGNVYDFVAMPGSEALSSTLEIIQPDAQVGATGAGVDNATAVYEAINATLTDLAPIITLTPTRAATATSTRTAIPTNTPRPSNTPPALPPTLVIQPSPPDAAAGTITVVGQYFAADKPFMITFDDSPSSKLSGRTNADGSLDSADLSLQGLAPGPHTLKLCVDCSGSQGLKLAYYSTFIVTAPDVTPSPRPVP